MQTKLEKQTTNKNSKVRGIATYLVISFFFVSFFLTICFFIFGQNVNLYISVMNKMAVVESQNEKQNITINPEKKELVTYPAWGKQYANITIPSINLKLPVYHGDNMKILKKGVGHYSGSYFNGEGGSIVFAGHSDYFHYLPNVQVNDEITVTALYGTFKYQVYETRVISRNDESALPIQEEEEILMIYTCYPVTAYGNPAQRFVVYAKLIEANYEENSLN